MYEYSEDEEARIRDLFQEGLSATEIIGRTGIPVTRAAMSGKLWRLGLYRAPVPKPKITPRGSEKRKVNNPIGPPRVAKSSTPMPKLPPVERPATVVPLADLEKHHCRYPFGHPKDSDFGFCGAPKMAGSAYCEGHHGRVWVRR